MPIQPKTSNILPKFAEIATLTAGPGRQARPAAARRRAPRARAGPARRSSSPQRCPAGCAETPGQQLLLFFFQSTDKQAQVKLSPAIGFSTVGKQQAAEAADLFEFF